MSMHFADLIRAQLNILEQLFAGAKPKKASQHPGVRRQIALREVLRNGGVIRLPEQREQLPMLGRVLLDSAVVVELTAGNMSLLHLGNLANLGDEQLLKKVLTRVTNPTQFEDVFVELAAAAWYQARGHKVELLEVPGLPDLKVRVSGVGDPLYVECKRAWTSATEALRNDLKDANRKFRNVQEPHFAIVMIDVTAALTLPEVPTDDLPDTLHNLIDIVERTLSGPKNRGVAKAVLTWDEHILLPSSDQPDAVAFRRRSVVIDHASKDEVRLLPNSVPVFEGFATLCNLDWQPRWLGVSQLALSGAARAAIDVFGLQSQDFLDAFHHHGKLEVVRCGPNLEMVIFLRRRGQPDARSDILAWATVADETLTVHGALVLPPELCLAADEWTLTETLRAVVDRYGVGVQTANARGRLILYDRVPYTPGTLPFIVHDSTEGQSITFVAFRWFNEPAGPMAEIAFLFSVRVDRLRGSEAAA